jgi:hypothetical protein
MGTKRSTAAALALLLCATSLITTFTGQQGNNRSTRHQLK